LGVGVLEWIAERVIIGRKSEDVSAGNDPAITG